MIDYEMLEAQRDTLQRVLDQESERFPLLDSEERNAIAGMIKLTSWMLDYAPETPTVVRTADEPIELSDQEMRVIGRALEVTELLGDVIAETLNEEPMHKPTLHALRDKIGVVA